MGFDLTKRYALRTVVGGAIIATLSPEANIGNKPQWVVKAPDGQVIYRIAVVEDSPTPTASVTSASISKKYSIKTKDGGEVFYIEPSSNMLPIVWSLRGKLGGSIVLSYYQDSTGKVFIKAPDSTLIYKLELLATPTADGQIVYTVKTRDNKINFYLAQY